MNIDRTLTSFGIFQFFLACTYGCVAYKKMVNESTVLDAHSDIARFSDSLLFSRFSLDFNHDGRMDIAFVNNPVEGDSLFLFEKSDSGFNLSLATLSLSFDGLFIIGGLEADADQTGFTLQTVFNGAGALKQTYSFEFNHSRAHWILKQTMTESCLIDESRSKEYCTIIQNLELSKLTDWTKLRDKREAQPEECVIK